MNIIMGASGQVGSAIVAQLQKRNAPVRGVVRSEEKAAGFKKAGVEYAIADAHDIKALTRAFQGGTTLFVLTPEAGQTEDLLADTKLLLENYKQAIIATSVRRLVGLSSMGAQYPDGTGNLKMSWLLENNFQYLAMDQVFLRPAYYFSNWLPGIKAAKENGVLYNFFPNDLEIPMVSPTDVAAFAAELIMMPSWPKRIYEIEGPVRYSPSSVAAAATAATHTAIRAEQTPAESWPEQLKKMGFSKDSSDNFIEMTNAVIAGKARGEQTDPIKGETTLNRFLEIALQTPEKD